MVPAVLLISFPFIPESPVWFIMQGRKNEASEALRYFRGAHYQTEAELTRLELHIMEIQETKGSILDLRNYKKALYITLGKWHSNIDINIDVYLVVKLNNSIKLMTVRQINIDSGQMS